MTSTGHTTSYDQVIHHLRSGVAIYRVLNDGLRGCDYVILHFNQAALEHEGKTLDQVVGKPLDQLRPSIEKFGLLEVFRQVWLTGEPGYYPAKVYVDDSFANYYENRVFRLDDDRIMAVYDDVTEQVRSAERIRESEVLLSEVMDSMDKAVAIYEAVDDGSDFVFVRMNAMAEEITHYTKEQVVGQRLSELFPGERSIGLIATLAEAWRTGETVRIPLKKYEDQRITQWVENTIFRLPSGRVVAMFEDTYAQRMAERELQESEARYRMAQRVGRVGSYEHDLGTGEIWQSEELRRIFGQDPSCEVVTVERMNGCVPDPTRLQEAFQQLLERESARDIEFEIDPEDGSPRRTVHASARLIRDEQGAPLKVVGTIRDISERAEQRRTIRELERRYAQAQRLETVGRLAGGVAHDFNNLLSVILSYTELALVGLPDGTPVEADLVEVKRAARQAADLTQQLLAFGRKQLREPVSLDLNAVLAGVENMFRRVLGDTVRYEPRLEAELGRVRADPGQIEQVLMNLALNARDAMPDGGTLILETANVELREGDPTPHHPVGIGSWVRLSLADTGQGMDEAVQARIFEPFFTTKPKGKGTGLGLSTVYGIIKQSEGEVFVSSAPLQGARFDIYLPRVDAEPAVVPVPAVAPVHVGGAGTILLAEDEDALRRALGRSLRRAGYRVLTAADGEQALRLSAAHEGEIALLVTDVVMPVMGGSELVERLLRARPGVKVLFMSGYTDETIVRHGADGESTHFLAKPFTSEALLQAVGVALDDG